jgi:hypothetical protein
MSGSAGKAPSFHEVVIEGHFERSHGLLLGLFLGARIPGNLYFSHEEGIRATFGERLREAVGFHAPVCHVVVDGSVRDLLERHQEELAAHGVRVAEAKPIRSSHFEFSYRAYAPRYAQEIRDLLAGLPPGVKQEGEPPRERVDQGAAGVEVYSPAHHYEFEGEGTIRGRIDLVIEARRRLAEHPLIRVERIELELD